MIRVEFTGNTFMRFMNPTTRKMEWYGNDMCDGHRIEFLDVVERNPKTLILRCLDGEYAVVDATKCRVVELP